MKRIYLLLFALLIFSPLLNAQRYYDIKMPTTQYSKKCKHCIELLKGTPPEIQFGIQRENNNQLYFVASSKKWFVELLKKGIDGLAIDIVNKDRYACEKESINKKQIVRGDIQKPIYTKELKKRMLESQQGELVIRLGLLPKKYHDQDIEFNLILLKSKNLCYYNNFYNLPTYRWDLLEMGMYLDSLTHKSENSALNLDQKGYVISHKTLRFEVPFQRNVSRYSSDDIQPLYDSLRLSDYDIKRINIRAYSSIEGKESRNIKLQNERANSIVYALQEFQDPEITTEIKASENWVEFMNDIVYSNYSYLSKLSKDEIKLELKNKELAEDLEPYLRNHRKAIITMELQKKNKFEKASPERLVQMFKSSLSVNNLDQAIEIQNAIFDKIRHQNLATSYVDQLEIPAKNEFGVLLNKNVTFKYLIDQASVYETFLELKKLEDILPDNGHVKYNLVACKFKVWLLGDHSIDGEDFKSEINALRKYNIPSSLVKRMLINYHIVMCEYNMQKADFYNKDKSLRYVYSKYRYLPLSDTDYLCLAQYFSSYSKYDWAKKLLRTKAKQIDVDEELLFYYLNLTIIDPSITKKSEYKSIMLNAININRSRYCKMFNANKSGGVTFQLLENDYLRSMYCENCNE